MNKVDFKKSLKNLYQPSAQQASIVEVPAMKFMMIEGVGDPNVSPDFENSVQALYGVSYAIKMLPKKGVTPVGYFDYVVPPLEGIWDTLDGSELDYGNKGNLKWTLMIMQPDFVSEEVFEKVKSELCRKKDPTYIQKVRFDLFEEGLCAQMLHIGPYDTEPATVERLMAFIDQEGYQAVKSGHHEIYLSDPRRTKPERLKTVIRYPIIPR